MDYFQGVVTEYLRANRATFVNTECCIQLNAGANPDTSGPHWYCDALAVNLQTSEAFLCEISYAKTLGGLTTRLTAWSKSWPPLRIALERDCGVPQAWPVHPWIFVPEKLGPRLEQQLLNVLSVEGVPSQMPKPKVTWLEDVAPWKYSSYNRPHADEDVV